MTDAADYSAFETLPDGGRIDMGAQRPQDRDGIRAALARTSEELLYHRFFTVKREFSEKEAHYFLDIDFVKHVALVAVADEDGRPTIVGGCRLSSCNRASPRSRSWSATRIRAGASARR